MNSWDLLRRTTSEASWMEKPNATTAFTYENIYGLCFCALKTHHLLPSILRRLLSALTKEKELVKRVIALEYVDAEGDIIQKTISLTF